MNNDLLAKVEVRMMIPREIPEAAKIACENFSGLRSYPNAARWMRCNLSSFPRMQYFVAVFQRKIVGYILWVEKGGFRAESVWELEQIAVAEEFRNWGIGCKLIQNSRAMLEQYLLLQKRGLKLVEITTGANNAAQRLYEKALGAKVVATIPNLFRGDEVIMIARFM